MDLINLNSSGKAFLLSYFFMLCPLLSSMMDVRDTLIVNVHLLYSQCKNKLHCWIYTLELRFDLIQVHFPSNNPV